MDIQVSSHLKYMHLKNLKNSDKDQHFPWSGGFHVYELGVFRKFDLTWPFGFKGNRSWLMLLRISLTEKFSSGDKEITSQRECLEARKHEKRLKQAPVQFNSKMLI